VSEAGISYIVRTLPAPHSSFVMAWRSTTLHEKIHGPEDEKQNLSQERIDIEGREFEGKLAKDNPPPAPSPSTSSSWSNFRGSLRGCSVRLVRIPAGGNPVGNSASQGSLTTFRVFFVICAAAQTLQNKRQRDRLECELAKETSRAPSTRASRLS
jgi:uncharacterized membrane protein